MTRPCRHENIEQRIATPRGLTRHVCILTEPDALVCLDCGAWLSLGPATPPPTIEIKLAAHIQEVCVLYEPKDQDELIERYVEGFASQPEQAKGEG